jgi:hypothetical protein
MTSIVVTKHEDPVFAALNAVDAAIETLLTADVTSRSTREQMQLLRRVKIIASRLPAISHRLIAAMRETATPAELGDPLTTALANALRITPKEAKRRGRGRPSWRDHPRRARRSAAGVLRCPARARQRRRQGPRRA